MGSIPLRIGTHVSTSELYTPNDLPSPLEEEVPLVVDMTLRGVDMTLWAKILEGQNWGPWVFSGPGTFKKRFPVKNDVEWYPQK